MNRYEQSYNDWLGARRYDNLVNISKQEWCNWWEQTGLFDMRGSQAGTVHMARIDKDLPFQLDNIRLMLKQGNGRGMKEIQPVVRGWDSKGWDA